jgi:hypothetical protein
VKAKSEAARIAAIRELLDRAYGKPTQYLAADNEVVRNDVSEEELQVQLFADFEQIFPEYEMVPRIKAHRDCWDKRGRRLGRSAAVFDK